MSELTLSKQGAEDRIALEPDANSDRAVSISYAIFQSLHDTTPQTATVPVDAFLRLFERREVVQDKKRAKLWCPAVFVAGGTRKSENVQSVTALVVDVDDGHPFSEIQERLAPFTYVAHSSHSHTTEHPKYRVVLPLGCPVPLGDWESMWPRLNALVGGHADPAAKDPARVYFLPSMPPGAEGHFVQIHGGRFIQPMDLPRLPVASSQAGGVAAKGQQRPWKGVANPAEYEGVEGGLEDMVRHCRFIQWATRPSNQEHVVEPLWMAMLSNVTRFRDGRAFAHQGSCEHSAYNAEETDARLVRHRTQSAPITCETIRERGFTGCPRHGCGGIDGKTVKSPAQLGRWQAMTEGTKEIPHPAILRSFQETHLPGPLIYAGGEFYYYRDGAYDRLEEKTEIEKPLMHFIGQGAKAKLLKDLCGLLAIQCAERGDVFVPERDYICLNNGTLDVKRGVLEEHSSAHWLRTRLDVPWDPEARCPRFLQFLNEVFAEDADRQAKIDFLRQWFGYILLADTSLQKMLWLVGAGANGKSVLLAIMTELVGLANVSHAMVDTFDMPHVRAELEGKLMNISSEMAANTMVNDGYVKAIVAGDMIEASRKYKPSFSFKPFVRLVAATNNLPRTNDGSAALYRRLIILRFTRRFTEAEQNPRLEDELHQELPGILVWAVGGLHQLRELGGFSIPPSSVAEVQQYQEDANPLHSFAKECLVPSMTKRIPVSELIALHIAWCRAYNFTPRNASTLGKALSELGFKPYKSGGRRGWLVELTDEAQVLVNRNFLRIGEEDLKPSVSEITLSPLADKYEV